MENALRSHYNVHPEQRKLWEAGLLSPKGLQRRAVRRAVTIFVSHFHQVGRTLLGYEPVKPYPNQYLGHADVFPVPCWALVEELLETGKTNGKMGRYEVNGKTKPRGRKQQMGGA